jgi:SAM-dependent methyltransferase
MGETFASRVAASILNTMDLSELVTTSDEDYFNVALNLAQNPEKLAAIKQKIVEQKQLSPLFDTKKFARDLERLYQTIWGQELRGERKAILLKDETQKEIIMNETLEKEMQTSKTQLSLIFDPLVEPWRFLDPGQNNHLGSLNPNYAPRGLIDLLDTPPALALDIGCFIGATGVYMKQKWPQCRVVGVEPVAEAAEQARTKVDAVFEGFFEDMPVGEAGIELGKVDLAVFADVLEHMRHPWGALRHIRDWLSPTGAVLVSLPNIRNLNVLKDLVGNGTFNYKPAGILDITHIRFFTRSDALKMFEQTGYTVEKMGTNLDGSLAGILQQVPKDHKISFDVGSKMRLNDVDYAEAEELCALQFWFLLRAKN